MIQQYVGEITEKHHNRMVSISDSSTPNGRIKVQIIWDLSVRAIAADHCGYTLLNDGGLYDRARLVRSLVEKRPRGSWRVLDMARSYTTRLSFIVFAACLWAPRGFEAHAGEHTVTFDVNGTPFHVPKAWLITPSRSDPPYSPPRAISPGQVFQTDQGIMINFFSDLSSSLSHRYPEITSPSPYEIAIDVSPPDAKHPQRRDKAAGNPVLTEQLAGRALDPDGFVKLGEQRYVGAQADDDDGMGHYLEFSYQAGLTDADSAVSRRCTTYIYVDAIRIRTVFDGAKYAKPDWRSAPRQAVALIKWLITQPDKRSEKIREL